MLAAGHLRGGTGGRDSDRGGISGGRADVPGGHPADRMRLRLLPALERRRFDEHRGLEISQGTAGNPAEIVPHQGITVPGSS